MALVGLFAIAIALAYFLLVVTSVNEPAAGGTYVEGVVLDANAGVSINPLFAPANSLSHDLTDLVFSGLTRSLPGRNQNEPGQIIAPDLAERWSASPDGKTWEFQLRQDARWQDGAAITSQDVVFTVNTLKSDDLPAVGRELSTLWKQVEVSRLGDYTVRFRLEQPWPAFLNYTTLGILPAHKLAGKVKISELLRADFNQAPVGNGPYQLAPGGLSSAGVTLITNPLYFGKKPYLDKIWFRFYPSASAALTALQSNQIDGVSQVTSDEVKRLATIKNVTEISAPSPRNTFLFFNLQRTTLFGQKEVRQALAGAINRQELIDKALAGQAAPSYSPVLSSSWAYKQDIKTYPYNVEGARNLLDGAGWKIAREGIRERNGQQLVFKMLVDDSPDKRAVAAYIAESLRAIEAAAQIDIAPSARELDAALKSSSYDALIFTVQGVFNDPDQYVNWHSSYADPGDNHYNFSNWRLDRADKLLESARITVQQEDRRKLYLDWQQIWADELPGIPLYSSTYHYVVSNRVGGVQRQNLKVINMASDRLKDISLRYIFTTTRFGV